MNLQSIFNFFTNPIGIVILFGLFSTGARMINSAQQQRVKKQALQKHRQAQQDSLRTGSSTQGVAAPLQTQSSKKAIKQAAWDQKQQTRRDRIEQLRTHRIEQLKKLRQQRSGGSQPQATPSRPQQSQARPSQPRPTRVSQQTSPRSPAQQQAAQPYKRPVAQPYAQPATPTRPARPTPPTPPVLPVSQPTRRRPRPQAVAQQQQAQDQARRVSQSSSNSPIAFGVAKSKRSVAASNTRTLFRKNIRQAIIAKEILGTPMGLRSPDSQTSGIL